MRGMPPKQVETFLWVVRLGSFAAAAEKLAATQATISLRINELEQNLGVKLFERSHRGVQVTATGRSLLGPAEEMAALTERILTEIGAEQAHTGKVRVGVADLIAMSWLDLLIPAVHEEFPRVDLDISIGMAIELVDGLRHGDYDLVLAPAEIWAQEFEALPLGHAAFTWMAGADLPLPNGRLRPSDIREFPVITLDQNSYHHRIVSDWFRQGAVKPRHSVACNSNHLIISLTLAGHGIGLVPVCAVEKELEDGALVIVDCEPTVPPVSFFALLSSATANDVSRRMAQLAAELSPFHQKAEDVMPKRNKVAAE